MTDTPTSEPCLNTATINSSIKRPMQTYLTPPGSTSDSKPGASKVPPKSGLRGGTTKFGNSPSNSKQTSRDTTNNNNRTLATAGKPAGSKNASILNFFRKEPVPEPGLFMPEGGNGNGNGGGTLPSKKVATNARDFPIWKAFRKGAEANTTDKTGMTNTGRAETPDIFIPITDERDGDQTEVPVVKRQKIADSEAAFAASIRSTFPHLTITTNNRTPLPTLSCSSTKSSRPCPGSSPTRRRGPFVDDSSDGDSDFETIRKPSFSHHTQGIKIETTNGEEVIDRPNLVKNSTPGIGMGIISSTGDMTERETLSQDPLGNDVYTPILDVDFDPDGDPSQIGLLDDAEVSLCPICNVCLDHHSADQASRHVNSCLDNPVGGDEGSRESGGTLSTRSVPLQDSSPRRADLLPHSKSDMSSEASGPVRIIDHTIPSSNRQRSALSYLMTTSSEQMAWSRAVTQDAAPKATRQCPFYKILPGMSLCVDAFRYGAVPSCKVYFLSHFHSDHYIGLSSTWSHGVIYASRETANLVIKKLRVKEEFVVGLEFDKMIPVPGCDGVSVTLIDANHCPGSAMFMFEKEGPRNTAGTSEVGGVKRERTRTRRILHCGDFRAHPKHIEHALLRPTITNTSPGMTGSSTSAQNIDVCYLDTTYLDPKYSFPNQDDVIQACVEKCLQLRKDDVQQQQQQQQENRGNPSELQLGNRHLLQSQISTSTPAISHHTRSQDKSSGDRTLYLFGTYTLGKENLVFAAAKALGSLVFALEPRREILSQLTEPANEDFRTQVTDDPRAASVHMLSISELTGEKMIQYLDGLRDRFDRMIAFRPSGWEYKPRKDSAAASRQKYRAGEFPLVKDVLIADEWKAPYDVSDVKQGYIRFSRPPVSSSPAASATADLVKNIRLFCVPYSEHSSFRELTLFCCSLRIAQVIPTVNLSSLKDREKMKAWIDRCLVESRKGLFTGKWY